jgi:hypothetical protein
MKAPRIAIYQSYLPGASEGWTRWILDNFEFSYEVIHNADFKNKSFARKYDAIIFASQDRNVIVDGKYVSKNRDFPSPFLPEKFQGGIGKDGVEALKQLVKNGGRVILIDAAYELAKKDFELPVSNIVGDKTAKKFNCPGSILQIQLENSDPLTWGLEPVSSLFFSDSAVFRAGNPQDMKIKRFVIGRFAPNGPHLLSGYLEGGEILNNAVAAVRYQYEKGQVLIFGGSIQFRAQTTATFKLLFNALFLQ